MAAAGEFTAHVAESVPERFLQRQAKLLGDVFDFYEGVVRHG